MENETQLQDECHDHFMNGTDYGKPKNIVYKLINNLTDRRGFSGEWDIVDEDVKEDLIQKWIDITEKTLNE